MRLSSNRRHLSILFGLILIMGTCNLYFELTTNIATDLNRNEDKWALVKLRQVNHIQSNPRQTWMYMKRNRPTSLYARRSLLTRPLTGLADVRPRYIYPFLPGNQGPNNQIQGLTSAIGLASLTNRTIVAAPFWDHQTGTLNKVYQMNETIDIEELRKLVNIASEEQFNQDCGHVVTSMINGLVRKWKDLESIIPRYKTRFIKNNMSLPITLKTGNNLFNLEHVISRIRTSGRDDFDRCLGYIYPYGDYQNMFYERGNLQRLIFNHLKRPVWIQEHQTLMSEQLWKTGGVLAVHWRLNEEYQQYRCRANDSYTNENHCKLARFDRTLIAKSLVEKMKMLNLTNIYLASTPNSANDLFNSLKKMVPTTFSSSDIVNTRWPNNARLHHENYLLSLLEQEICFKSNYFIGSPLSSWSDNVIRQRDYRQTSLLSEILLMETPQYTTTNNIS